MNLGGRAFRGAVVSVDACGALGTKMSKSTNSVKGTMVILSTQKRFLEMSIRL